LFVFPMAGASRRFSEAGYNLPKYMLEAKGKSLFTHSVEGFRAYFNSEHFLFISRGTKDTAQFIKAECHKMGLVNYDIAILEKPTLGQAHTVYLGLSQIEILQDFSITIFNIDTFRPNFFYPSEFKMDQIDGYIEVFKGEGKQWSFVRPAEFPRDAFKVAETSEKRPISNLCCTGIYHFQSAKVFSFVFEEALAKPQAQWEAGELYVAPMYNHLIKLGYDIRYKIIYKNEVIFCGVPDEYISFCNS
jgi:hypothetical protein